MIDPISQEYLSLSFAIRRVFPDFIDAYVGPPEDYDLIAAMTFKASRTSWAAKKSCDQL